METWGVWGGCAPSEAEKICNFQSQFARFGAFFLPGGAHTKSGALSLQKIEDARAGCAPPPLNPPLVCLFVKWHIRWVVSHGNPEKMFPSNVLISLEAEKNPLSLIENPHKSPFRNFFYDHSKVELFSFLCSNFYKKILSITRQRKNATAVAQLTLILNARVSYHKCHTHK